MIKQFFNVVELDTIIAFSDAHFKKGDKFLGIFRVHYKMYLLLQLYDEMQFKNFERDKEWCSMLSKFLNCISSYSSRSKVRLYTFVNWVWTLLMLGKGLGGRKLWFVFLFYIILSYFVLYKITPGIFFVEMLKVADIVLGI